MTTVATKTSRLEKATKFLQTIECSTRDNNGAQATLKRALTEEPRHLRGAYPFTLPYLPIDPKQGDWWTWWIFIACLSTYHPSELNLEKRFDFGHSARKLAEKTESKGVDRRFQALLDTSLEDLRSPLSALVRLMKSKAVPIDYPQLIDDLCRWDHPDQYIQDRWARTFWKAPQQEEGSPR